MHIFTPKNHIFDLSLKTFNTYRLASSRFAFTTIFSLLKMYSAGGGGTPFFSGSGVRRAARISKVWGLRTDICLWKRGLVNWKFPNLRACELKFPNFGACELKFAQKLRLSRLFLPNFLKRRSNVNWLLCLKWGPCELQERREKGVFKAAYPHTPYLGQYPHTGILHTLKQA